MTLTKQDMINNLIGKLNLEKESAKKLVESFFEEIRLVLEKGENIKFSGFGNFELRDKIARPGRNPRTGEYVTVSARRVVLFKAGLKLRKQVENAVPSK